MLGSDPLGVPADLSLGADPCAIMAKAMTFR
jgi:hypothetical protein